MDVGLTQIATLRFESSDDRTDLPKNPARWAGAKTSDDDHTRLSSATICCMADAGCHQSDVRHSSSGTGKRLLVRSATLRRPGDVPINFTSGDLVRQQLLEERPVDGKERVARMADSAAISAARRYLILHRQISEVGAASLAS
jgi:hypothetical protein